MNPPRKSATAEAMRRAREEWDRTAPLEAPPADMPAPRTADERIRYALYLGARERWERHNAGRRRSDERNGDS
jgi:hypothetical protein